MVEIGRLGGGLGSAMASALHPSLGVPWLLGTVPRAGTNSPRSRCRSGLGQKGKKRTKSRGLAWAWAGGDGASDTAGTQRVKNKLTKLVNRAFEKTRDNSVWETGGGICGARLVEAVVALGWSSPVTGRTFPWGTLALPALAVRDVCKTRCHLLVFV